jgi:hypothetical protein
MKSLEEKLTKGSALYIDSLIYSKEEATILVKFFPNVESEQVDRILKFFEVTDFFEDKFEGYDETITQTLIGFDEVLQGDKSRFTICTEEEEYSFLADSKPELEFI